MSVSVSTVLPPSRTCRDENFPVASCLFPAATRQHILAFYHFARTADDVADTPDLTADERFAHLDRLEQTLRQDNPFWLNHALMLLQAFHNDIHVSRYQNWDDLVDSCRHSAVPVGRFLLDLHRESPCCYEAADSLCIALQILNHLQDCGQDYRHRGQIYLPQETMNHYGATESMLAELQSTPALRQVLNHLLDQTIPFLQAAQGLLPALSSHRLRLEAAVILTMAERLGKKLRHHDPLAVPVRLSKPQMVMAGTAGLVLGLWFGLKRRSTP